MDFDLQANCETLLGPQDTGLTLTPVPLVCDSAQVEEAVASGHVNGTAGGW